MEKAKVIVVVEDKEEEQQRALAAIKQASGVESEEIWFRVRPGNFQCGLKEAKILVLFAADLEHAHLRLDLLCSMSKAAVVGVLTDLMFPAKAGMKEEPNGLEVVVACIDAALPVVVCSDTDHHDVGYLKSVFPVLGRAHPKGEIPVILDHKDWYKAVELLLALLHADPV